MTFPRPSPLAAIATRWRRLADAIRDEARSGPASEAFAARSRARVYDACAEELEDLRAQVAEEEA